MKGDEMVGLTSSILKQFEETYEKIKQLRNVFHKQLALDTKIEKVEVSGFDVDWYLMTLHSHDVNTE
jgi:hypothetical protein